MKTTYSKTIPGSPGNYNWNVSFDETDGFIGITQMQGKECERVLLNKHQVRALIEFVIPKKRKK